MFKSKKIKNQNGVGEILKQARSKTGLSLKLVGKHININPKYLAALEKDAWHKLPGEIYAKNFLKKYCQFLKINPQKIKINFDKIPHFTNNKYRHEFKKKTHKKDFLNLPKILKVALMVVIGIIILYYIIWQINNITQPPQIILFYPTQDLTTSYNALVITGQTEPEVKLKINHQEVILDENSNFQQEIKLSPGLNTITIEGKKKYSKTRIIERKIIIE